MAYTAPATWSVGESPTAAKLNAQIRDNVAYLHDSMPQVQLYASGAQTIPNATWTTIAFDSEQGDNDTMHDTSSNNSRITMTTGGQYMLCAQAPMKAAAATVALGVRFLFDGSGAFATLLAAGALQDGNGPSISVIWGFSATHYVEMQVFQNSGGNLDTISGFPGVLFSARRLSA